MAVTYDICTVGKHSKPADPYKLCAYHREYYRNNYTVHKKLGRCATCGVKVANGKVRCDDCLQRQREALWRTRQHETAQP